MRSPDRWFGVIIIGSDMPLPLPPDAPRRRTAAVRRLTVCAALALAAAGTLASVGALAHATPPRPGHLRRATRPEEAPQTIVVRLAEASAPRPPHGARWGPLAL